MWTFNQPNIQNSNSPQTCLLHIYSGNSLSTAALHSSSCVNKGSIVSTIVAYMKTKQKSSSHLMKGHSGHKL